MVVYWLVEVHGCLLAGRGTWLPSSLDKNLFMRKFMLNVNTCSFGPNHSLKSILIDTMECNMQIVHSDE